MLKKKCLFVLFTPIFIVFYHPNPCNSITPLTCGVATSYSLGAASQLTGSASPNAITPWTSSIAGVATVSSTSLVKGVSAGTSVITYMNLLTVLYLAPNFFAKFI